MTITVIGRVWYVNGAAANGSGVSSSPFNTLTSANTAHNSNDFVFVQSGGSPTATPGAISLKSGATLWGQGTALPTIGGVTINNTAASSKPVIGGTVTLAGNNTTVSSLDIASTSNTGLTNSGTLTGVSVTNNVGVTTTTGMAIDLNNASGALSFLQVSSNGAPRGIRVLNMSSGSLSVLGTGAPATGGTISNSTNTASGDGSIVLTNVGATVQLNNMALSSANGAGVFATDVASLTVAKSTFANFPTLGVMFQSNSTSSSTNGGSFNLHDNTFSSMGASSIQLSITNKGTWTGHIVNNTIGNAGLANSGSANGEGFDVWLDGAGTLTADISNNKIYQIKQSYGISSHAGTAAGTLNLSLIGNTVNMVQPSSLDGVTVDVGFNTAKVCLNASGNTVTGAGVSPTNGWGYNSVGLSVLQDSPAGTSTFQIQGYSGAATNLAAVQTYLESTNTLAGPTPVDKSIAVISNPPNGFTNAVCPTAP